MRKVYSLIVGALAFAFTAVPALAVSSVVYDALPSVDPLTSYPSQPFQAQQTVEFGDSIHLGGTARILDKVTVTMVTWARFSEYSSNPLYSGNNLNWTHPITLNIYSTHLLNRSPDQLLSTVTQNINVPWRPEGDPSCPDTGYGAGFAWKDSLGTCRNGLAFNAVFDLSSLNVTLPDDVIVSVAYNTQSYGKTPLNVNGPYNSLNVAVPANQVVTVGNDNNTDSVFWNSLTYTSGVFREDTGWTPTGTVALKVEAQVPPTSYFTKDQCKDNGWKNFTFPVFKNQGQCVSFFANEKSGLFVASDSLYYSGSTISTPLYGTGAFAFTWDKSTGKVTDGYYKEIYPAHTGSLYNNKIVSGTVAGNNVTLNFQRGSYNFSFTGTLSGSTLSGQLAGPYLFVANGTVTQ